MLINSPQLPAPRSPAFLLWNETALPLRAGMGGSNQTGLTSDTDASITESPHPGASQAQAHLRSQEKYIKVKVKGKKKLKKFKGFFADSLGQHFLLKVVSTNWWRQSKNLLCRK